MRHLLLVLALCVASGPVLADDSDVASDTAAIQKAIDSYVDAFNKADAKAPAGRWTVQTLSVLPDGRRASSTNVYELIEGGKVRFRSVGREVDGELLPNVGPVEVVRTAL